MRLPRWSLVLLALGACQVPGAETSAFTTMIVLTSVSGTTFAEDTSSSSSSGGSTTTGDGSSSGETGAETFAEPPRDLGTIPDFGEGPPVGCNGKIDFLFVISRQANMRFRQEQLAAAFPQFIETIESKFANFDYHIMVVDGDDEWGNSTCTALCPDLGCKVGEDCCPWSDGNQNGKPCCGDPESYPCEDLDKVTACDRTWGAGTVFPTGLFTADKPCPIDGDYRYLRKGQTDLAGTFACMASVGTSGYDMLGQAFMAAMQKPINDPGGCNRGFLRDDALLMVTFIATNPDQEGALGSEGTPTEWAQAVLDAKHGDANSVVMLNILNAEATGCYWFDRVCQMTTMFPYRHSADATEPDYGPAFTEAADLVEAACDGFVGPG